MNARVLTMKGLHSEGATVKLIGIFNIISIDLTVDGHVSVPIKNGHSDIWDTVVKKRHFLIHSYKHKAFGIIYFESRHSYIVLFGNSDYFIYF